MYIINSQFLSFCTSQPKKIVKLTKAHCKQLHECSYRSISETSQKKITLARVACLCSCLEPYWGILALGRFCTVRSVHTATTSGQYSPVRPSRSVSKRLIFVLSVFKHIFHLQGFLFSPFILILFANFFKYQDFQLN